MSFFYLGLASIFYHQIRPRPLLSNFYVPHDTSLFSLILKYPHLFLPPNYFVFSNLDTGPAHLPWNHTKKKKTQLGILCERLGGVADIKKKKGTKFTTPSSICLRAKPKPPLTQPYTLLKVHYITTFDISNFGSQYHCWVSFRACCYVCVCMYIIICYILQSNVFSCVT